MNHQKLDFEKKAEAKKDVNFFLLGKEGKWFFTSPYMLYLSMYEMVQIGRKLTHQSLFEILWTVIPALILVILAVPSLQLLYSLDFIVIDYEPIITVKVLGHQWYWNYEYIIFSELNALNFELVSFDSYLVPEDELNLDGLRLLEVDNPLIIPGNNYIRFLVSSVDVLHAWAVPSLGIKVDAVPGRLNQVFTFIKRTGDFYGQCSEICGVNHGFMPIRIVSSF
jgi:cytochrome c oxidase subunit 2